MNSDDIFEEEIRKQVLMAVDEADVILFVVDVMNGVTAVSYTHLDVYKRQQLMQRTGADPDDIDLVIVATSTPDYHCLLYTSRCV